MLSFRKSKKKGSVKKSMVRFCDDPTEFAVSNESADGRTWSDIRVTEQDEYHKITYFSGKDDSTGQYVTWWEHKSVLERRGYLEWNSLFLIV